MPQLNAAEQAFLDARQAEQAELQALKKAADDELAPIIAEYHEAQVAIDDAMAVQAEIANRKRAVIEKHDLGRIDRELADVAKDVTKLLRKLRS